jgi:hypothetical protein
MRILIGTLIHLALTFIFSFLALGTTLGLGFKDSDKWTMFDHVYSFVSIYGLKILYGPINLFWQQFEHFNEITYLLAFVLNSFIQVALIVWLWSKLKGKYAS